MKYMETEVHLLVFYIYHEVSFVFKKFRDSGTIKKVA
jgi:hypothetical protein